MSSSDVTGHDPINVPVDTSGSIRSSKDIVGRGVPNPEALIRMNFLSQAAALMAVVDGGPDLSRFYMKTMKDVAQKLVIRIDPQNKQDPLDGRIVYGNERSKNAAIKDRHAPRATAYHPANFKKSGGGKGNWGRQEDYYDESEIPINQPFQDPELGRVHVDNSKIRVAPAFTAHL
ncbi:hypothetical protein PSACC_00797 [Paramicrosporidium saccamoebae]|uniref:Hyaluronan/mRNA-binding protein domain-containing protein n=1 Tax=Paramicrosporidium saccamoebae TaxID=1246581 RepID=A0A2H9TNU0_9FUNG|nr:hypothetical protein PSACC_00797 [Paramicrosporidium saccamoebae]